MKGSQSTINIVVQAPSIRIKYLLR